MDQVDNILEKRAIRITPMRQLLLTHFLEKNKALGRAELELAFPRADRITLYRTLKTFEAHGIIHSISNQASEIKYALCNEFCQPHLHIDYHPHFYCLKCKTTECLNTILIERPSLPIGYISQKMKMNIEGICANCN